MRNQADHGGDIGSKSAEWPLNAAATPRRSVAEASSVGVSPSLQRKRRGELVVRIFRRTPRHSGWETAGVDPMLPFPISPGRAENTGNRPPAPRENVDAVNIKK